MPTQQNMAPPTATEPTTEVRCRRCDRPEGTVTSYGTVKVGKAGYCDACRIRRAKDEKQKEWEEALARRPGARQQNDAMKVNFEDREKEMRIRTALRELASFFERRPFLCAVSEIDDCAVMTLDWVNERFENDSLVRSRDEQPTGNATAEPTAEEKTLNDEIKVYEGKLKRTRDEVIRDGIKELIAKRQEQLKQAQQERAQHEAEHPEDAAHTQEDVAHDNATEHDRATHRPEPKPRKRT